MVAREQYSPKTAAQADAIVAKLEQFKGCDAIGMNGNTFVEIWKTLEEGANMDITQWGYQNSKPPIGTLGVIWGTFIYLDNKLPDWKIKSQKRVVQEVMV